MDWCESSRQTGGKKLVLLLSALITWASRHPWVEHCGLMEGEGSFLLLCLHYSSFSPPYLKLLLRLENSENHRSGKARAGGCVCVICVKKKSSKNQREQTGLDKVHSGCPCIFQNHLFFLQKGFTLFTLFTQKYFIFTEYQLEGGWGGERNWFLISEFTQR